jgi:hypothetical protein
MTKLKIANLTDDKPVTITVKLPAAVHRDLLIYAQALQQEGGRIEPTSLVAPDVSTIHGSRLCIQEIAPAKSSGEHGITLFQKPQKLSQSWVVIRRSPKNRKLHAGSASAISQFLEYN